MSTFKWTVCVAAGALVGAVAYVVLVPSFQGPAAPSAAPETARDGMAPARKVGSAPDHDESRSDSLRILDGIRQLPSDFERAAALYDVLRNANAPTIKDLLREAGESRVGEATKSIIYARFADLDPGAAVDHIVDAREDKRFLTNVFSNWAGRDIDAALDHAELLPPRYKRTAAIAILSANQDLDIVRKREIAQRFSIQDLLQRALQFTDTRANPQQAWRDALAMPSGDSRTQSGWQALRAWVAVSPERALEALETWPDGRVRDHWQLSLVGIWARDDVRAALDWALAQPDGSQRDGLVASAAILLAPDSPLEAVEVALTLSPHERRRINRVALREWGRGDPVGALHALNDIADPQFANGMRRGLVAAWAGTDPHAAFEWVLSQPAMVDHTWLLETPLAILAQTSPEDAMALANGLDDEARRTILPSVLKAWSDNNPAGAASRIDANGYDNREATNRVAASFALHDAVDAFDWVAGLPTSVRRATLPSLMASVSQDAPATARLLIEQIDDPTIRRNAAGPLVFYWAESDPEAAVRWIGDAENVGNRGDLYHNVFTRWSQLNRTQAVAAARRLPVPARESATVGMINTGLALHDIEFVDEMLDTLDDERARRNAARMIHSRLPNVDPDLAARYRELAGR